MIISVRSPNYMPTYTVRYPNINISVVIISRRPHREERGERHGIAFLGFRFAKNINPEGLNTSIRNPQSLEKFPSMKHVSFLRAYEMMFLS